MKTHPFHLFTATRTHRKSLSTALDYFSGPAAAPWEAPFAGDSGKDEPLKTTPLPRVSRVINRVS